MSSAKWRPFSLGGDELKVEPTQSLRQLLHDLPVNLGRDKQYFHFPREISVQSGMIHHAHAQWRGPPEWLSTLQRTTLCLCFLFNS